jgi:hypothetical protein
MSLAFIANLPLEFSFKHQRGQIADAAKTIDRYSRNHEISLSNSRHYCSLQVQDACELGAEFLGTAAIAGG